MVTDILRTADETLHAFIRARPGELNLSWDRVDDQSQIGRRAAMSSPTVDAGEGYERGHAATISAHSARATATRAFNMPFFTAKPRAQRPNAS